jgi:hypothetical protein
MGETDMDHGQLAARWIAVCCGALIAALFFVGVEAHETVRHTIQAGPLCIGVVFGIRGTGLAKWAGLALCLFWLMIATLIFLHLTGVAHVINGHFPPFEIAMTTVLAAAGLAGVLVALFAKSGLKAPAATAIFILVAALQVGAMALALQPGFAHDADFPLSIG